MAARKEPKGAPPPTEPGTAEQSAITALQALLDEERIAHAVTRAQLERVVPSLETRIAELEAELARASARLRELDAQLQARGR